MSFAQETGYTPATFSSLIDSIRDALNTQFGTSYTEDSFIGTNWYKYAYAIAQKIQENDVKASEIFQILQEYITLENERISRPSVSHPGLIQNFSDSGYIASIKQPAELDAGKIFICAEVDDEIAGEKASGSFVITSFANLVSGTDDSVTVGATVFTAQTGSATPGAGTFQAATSNSATATSLATQINAHATAGALVKARAFGSKVVITALLRGTAGNSIALNYTDNDSNVGATKSGTALSGGTAASSDYAANKLEIATLIKNYVAAGLVSVGDEEEDITLANGQEFTFAFQLPDRIPVTLRLTLNASENSLLLIPSDEDLRQQVFDQIGERYRLGYNFEPQRYFTLDDAPWASSLVLEWSGDGGTTWDSSVFDAEYDEVFDFDLEDIDIVINE